jgi:hypothetical protein
VNLYNFLHRDHEKVCPSCQQKTISDFHASLVPSNLLSNLQAIPIFGPLVDWFQLLRVIPQQTLK